MRIAQIVRSEMSQLLNGKVSQAHRHNLHNLWFLAEKFTRKEIKLSTGVSVMSRPKTSSITKITVHNLQLTAHRNQIKIRLLAIFFFTSFYEHRT